MIQKAIEFAYQVHSGQFRKDSNIPYIVHPLDVLRRVFTYGMNDDFVMAAAILHDTVEDTHATDGDIRIEFGDVVADLVKELTRPTNANKNDWIGDLAKNGTPEAIIIKYADRISNVEDFILANNSYWRAYAEAAQPIYDRVFHDPKIVEIAPNIIKIAHKELTDKDLGV